jgi:hypothetical protein
MPTQVAVAMLAALLLVLVALVAYTQRRKRKTPDLAAPPPGYFANPKVPPPSPGDLWPANPCAGGPLPYFLVTPLCPGKTPGLVNGGGGKCTNSANTVWTGCVHATAAAGAP